MALTQSEVSQLYVAVFGKASEGEGNRYWQTAHGDMKTTADVMMGLSVTAEYFGTALNTNQAFVEHIYKNTLGKTVQDDPAGIAYWVGELDAGKTKGDVISSLIVAAQHSANAGAAQDRFNNKVLVSNHTADTIEKFTDTATFQSFINGVDDTLASVSTAKATIDATPGAGAVVFTLTSSPDLIGNPIDLVGVNAADVNLL